MNLAVIEFLVSFEIHTRVGNHDLYQNFEVTSIGAVGTPVMKICSIKVEYFANSSTF